MLSIYSTLILSCHPPPRIINKYLPESNGTIAPGTPRPYPTPIIRFPVARAPPVLRFGRGSHPPWGSGRSPASAHHGASRHRWCNVEGADAGFLKIPKWVPRGNWHGKNLFSYFREKNIAEFLKKWEKFGGKLLWNFAQCGGFKILHVQQKTIWMPLGLGSKNSVKVDKIRSSVHIFHSAPNYGCSRGGGGF